MEMVHLHAIFDSPLVRAAHPLRLSQAALREPVADGRPVSIMQKVSDDLDGGAELHHLIGDAGDRAGSLDDDGATCRWSCEERARAPRTALWGRVGWMGLWYDLPA